MNRDELIERINQGPESRSALIDEVLRTSIPLQIRMMREDRKWTQQDLARRTGMRQSVISRLETVGAPLPTVATLTRIAKEFDVALLVTFEDWPDFIEWAAGVGPTIAPASFDAEF